MAAGGRMIGGEVHSKFFSLIDKTRQVRGPHATRHAKLSGEARERVHARAKKHDEELRVQQRIYREISVFAARPSKRAHPANTVKGIRYCPDRPGVAKARGAGRVLEPGFMVSAHDREGRPFTEYCAISQPLTEASWEKAWMKAVRALVERKLPKRVQDAAALILRKPEIVETLRLSGELAKAPTGVLLARDTRKTAPVPRVEVPRPPDDQTTLKKPNRQFEVIKASKSARARGLLKR